MLKNGPSISLWTGGFFRELFTIENVLEAASVFSEDIIFLFVVAVREFQVDEMPSPGRVQ
jgi:hypothetical protein